MKRFFLFILILAVAALPISAANGESDFDDADIDVSNFLGEEAVEAAAAAIDITSPCAILVEKTTGAVLYERNADERRHPASVTKVMTELLAVEAIAAGVLSLDDTVVASAHAVGMGGTQIYLREGEQMTVRDIMKAIVINSANDAAVALGEHIAGSEQAFVARMNERAAQLGMTNTNFTNASGLINDDDHYTTARDIALMSRELITHDMIKDFTTVWMDSLRGGETMLANTNQLIRYYNGATGLKTGFTQRAGYCLAATAMRDGVEYIAVTLGDATSADRFDSARALLTYAFANFALVGAEPDGPLLPIRVELGARRYIQPEPETLGSILVPRSDAGGVTRELRIAPQLAAPVREGDEVGTLIIKSEDRVLREVRILAGETSERLSWGAIFLRFAGLLFTNPEY